MKNRPTLAAAAHGLSVVPLDLVDIEAQERTTSGLDMASLAELASSIMREGLMQPPLLRWKGARLVVVAGERRVRACRLAGLVSIHAIVGDADDNRARLLRLAENHQRENLSTAETAAAVKGLADEGMSLTQIAEVFNKSKAWTSKMLGVSREDFSQRARFLLEHGHCEDLEKLHILSQLELATPTKPERLAELARDLANINRAELRKILKEAKNGNADEEADEGDDTKPAVSDKPPSAKVAKLQLDQHTATLLLDAVRTCQREHPSTALLDALDFLNRFVVTTWPDAREVPELAAAAAVEPQTQPTATKAGKAKSTKYRNAKTGDTWSGRGLQPKWLKVALAAGAKLGDFEVR